MKGAGFSEFETYGNYVNTYYPQTILLRRLSSIRNGRRYFGDTIEDELIEWAARDFDTISIEKWTKKQEILIKAIPVLKHVMSLKQMIYFETKYQHYRFGECN